MEPGGRWTRNRGRRCKVTDSERCGAPKNDGQPCGVTFGLCECHGRCFTHAPCREAERDAARRRGADRTNRPDGSLPPGEVPPPPENLRDAVVWAAWASHAVATGDLDTARANSTARLLKEFRNALERGEARAGFEETRRKLEELHGDGPDLEAAS